MQQQKRGIIEKLKSSEIEQFTLPYYNKKGGNSPKRNVTSSLS